MQLNEKLMSLYQEMYGSEFNRTLLIGSLEKGYDSHHITNIKELNDVFSDLSKNNEIYISVYDFDTEEDINRWMKTESYKFIETAKKNCIVIRFRESFDIIKEETKNLNDVQKFMFIRRSINLGFDNLIVDESKKTYEFLYEEFGIKSFMIFNGLNECSLYLFINEVTLNNPSETFYVFLHFLEKELNLKTITYKDIEPFSQVISLPGSQNNNSKLYTKPYDVNWEYEEIIKNSSDREMNGILPVNQDTTKIEEKLVKIDEQITKNPSRNKILNMDIKKL